MAKTAEQYAAELGAVQKQYQLAKAQGQSTAAYEQQGQTIRSQATAGGADISKLGASNQYGQDYTSFTNPNTNAALPTNTSSAQSYIDSLNAARRNQVMADLGKSRDNALSNLGAEKATIAPKYYDNRNTAAAGSQQSARNLAEFMAARGGVSSGANAQAEISRAGTLQGNLGTLGRQETAAFDDIARRTSGVQNAYESNLASANAGLEGDRMQALLNQYNADRGYGLDYAGTFGQLPGGGPMTLGANNQQYNQNMQSQQYDRGVLESNRNFEYTQARDQIKDQQYKQTFDENVKQSGLDYAVRKATEDRMLENTRADNTRLGSSGSSASTNNSYAGTVYDQLAQLDSSDYDGYLNANKAEIVRNIGQKAFDDLKKSALSDQSASGKTQSTIRDKAISAAQKDLRWSDTANRSALIKEYEGYFQ